MAALALHDLNQHPAVAAHRDALRELAQAGGSPDVAPLLAQLEEALAAEPPLIPTAVDVLDHAPPPALADLVPQAIWSVPLEDSLIRRRYRAAQEGEEPAGQPNAIDQ